MTIRYNDYWQLTKALELTKPLSTFVKDNLFKNEYTSPYDTVPYEKITASDGLAHVTIKNAPAKLVGKETRSLYSYSMITTNEKVTFSPDEFERLQHLGNNTIQGQMSQFDAYVLRQLKRLKDRFTRRQEQMCCEALSTGKITITEDDGVYEIDYGFTTDHKKTLSSTTKWNVSTGDPFETIIGYQQTISKRCGLKADIVIMGEQAATDFRSNALVLSKLNNLNYQVGKLNPFAQSFSPGGAIPMGTLPDGTQLFMYNQVYTNASGVSTSMINTNSIVVTCSEAVNEYFEYDWGTFSRFNPDSQDFKIQQIQKQIVDVEKDRNGRYGAYTLQTLSVPVIKSPEPIIVATVHV